MPYLVDSNVILDIILEDPNWKKWSLAQLEEYADETLIADPILYAELSVRAESPEEIDFILQEFAISLEPTPRLGLFLTGKAHLTYRQNGGTREKALPGFFIGGHAQALGAKIITRDVKKYRTYFPKVELITP